MIQKKENLIISVKGKSVGIILLSRQSETAYLEGLALDGRKDSLSMETEHMKEYDYRCMQEGVL
jgi:hypothetical protein